MGKFSEWRREFGKHKYLILISLFFLVIAVVLNYVAGSYTRDLTNAIEVPDLLLKILPVVNLEFFFTWFYVIIMVIFFAYPIVFKPKRIHTYFGLFSLLILTRAIFIVFTHLKTPIEAIPVSFIWPFENMFFSNDCFFSGHVALPFLGYLLARKENKVLSIFMIISSIVMSITVLLMHRHYSIDVFAAFFITYGVYKIGIRIFNGEKK